MENIPNNIHVKFTDKLFTQIRDYLLGDESQKERICYIAAHKVQTDNKLFVYPQKIYIPEYDVVDATRVSVRLDHEIVGAIYRKFGESEFDVLINAHSHPFDESEQVYFSGIDDRYDRLESEYLHKEIIKVKQANEQSEDIMHLSLVFGQKSLNARHTQSDGSFHTVKYLDRFGSSFNREFSSSKKKSSHDLWDRQILAFGKEAQEVFNDITVAIVGAGGIGSIVAEGLVRLGVRDIHLIDDDVLEATNLNRWQGGKIRDVGKPKTKVLAQNLRQYQPDISVTENCENVISEKSVASLKQCDFIFSCVDNVETRFFLNRIASRYQIPVFDSGVGIIDSDKEIKTKWQNITYVPGYTRCFDCSEIRIYDKDKMCRSFFDKTTTEFMRDQGYIKDEPDIKQPAAYHLNMFAASITLYEFHNYLAHFKDFNWCISGNLSKFNKITNHIIGTDRDGSDIPIQVLDNSLVEDQDPYCTNCCVYRGTGDYWSIDGFYSGNKLKLDK